MSVDRFPACLELVLYLEGGYSNDPHDRGGPTQSGITQATYDAYRQARGQGPRDVRELTRDELRDIYWGNYWVASRAGNMPAGLDLAVFDFAVNSGPVRAIKVLQQVLGVPADGHCGAVTTAALTRADVPAVIRSYLEARRAFLRGLATFWRFGAGWLNRCARIEADALEAAGMGRWGASALVSYDLPPPDLAERSAEQGRAVPTEPRPPVMAEIGAAGSGTMSFGFALPNIIARGFPGGKFSAVAFAVALTSEPLFWAGLAMLWGAIAMWRWRVQHARAT